VYYTVIKHDGHLRTRGKCRKQEPQASVFYISRVFSNVRSVLSQCNTRLRLLHLLYDIEVMWRETIKQAFSMFYTLIKHRFLTNQSARRVLSILWHSHKNPTLVLTNLKTMNKPSKRHSKLLSLIFVPTCLSKASVIKAPYSLGKSHINLEIQNK